MFPSGLQGQNNKKKFTDFYEESDLVVELPKMKGYCTKEIINEEILTSKDAVKKLTHYFESTKPLIDYLNKAIEFEA